MAAEDRDAPSFGMAMKNRKVQFLTGSLIAIIAAAAGAAAIHSTSSTDTAPISNRAQVEQIIHDYLLEHPEILPQAMERLQSKRVSALIDARRQEIETPYAGSWEGAADGDVVLVEFFDYNCGYCRASLSDIAKLLAIDRKLKVVYRELPILADSSTQAARVSLLAAEQGKYAAFHKVVYAGGHVTKESILTAAVSAGLQRKAAEQAMSDPRFDSEIQSNLKLAQALGASGTPTFVIGGQMLEGAVGYDTLKAAVAEARVKK